MHKPDMRQLPISQLMVDLSVQRPLDERRANSIAGDLNLDAIGTPCISDRGRGRYAIIDGQHRIAALRISGWTNEEILCEVFTGLSLADEAAMFRLRNNTAKPQYLDKFRVKLVEGDASALAVMDILRKYKWLLPGQEGDAEGRFMAVYSLERIYNVDKAGQNKNVAEKTVAVLTKAWGHTDATVDGRLVDGLGRFLLRYGDAVDIENLAEKLTKSGTATSLLGKARTLRSLLNVTMSDAIAEILVEIYNKRKGPNALPPWRS